MFGEHRLATSRPRVLMAIGLLACAPAWSDRGPSATDDAEATHPIAATTIRGQVRDPERRPLADATVRLLGAGLSARSRTESWVVPVVTRTADDGSFAAAVVEGAEYTVRVEAGAYAPFTARGIPAGASLKLHLEPGHALRGRVLDHETGRPIGGARVVACDEEAFHFGEESCRIAHSDAEGRFALTHLPDGPTRLQARAEAHAVSDSLSIELPRPASPAVELRLLPGARIAGRVLDDDDRPVEDALVTFTARSRPPNQSPWRGDEWPLYTSTDGSFVQPGLPAGGRYDLRVRKPGYPPVSAGPYLVETGRDVSDVTVRLRPGATLRLRLVDADGNPVEDRLTVLSRDASRREASAVSAGTPIPEEQIVAQPDGWYRIENLEAGTREFVFRPDHWADVERSEVELRPGRTTDLGPLLVQAGSRIAGRVTDPSGLPIPEARIEALYQSSRGWVQRSAPSDQDGRYELNGLGDEPLLMVQASAAGYGDADRSDVTPGDTTVDFVLEPTGAIVGRVVLDDGEPVTLFSVRAHPEARDPVEAPGGGLALFRALTRSFTSEDGSFRLEAVDAGSYTVEVRAGGKAPASKPDVAVSPGEIVSVGTITLVDGTALRGQVLDLGDDAPIAGARVEARPQGGWLSQIDEASAVAAATDAEGAFVIEGLGPGPHGVRVTHAEFAPAEVRVLIEPDAPPQALQVHLSQGGTLSGTVRDVEGRPVGDAMLGLSPGSVASGDLRSATTGADGRYRIERIAPGSYQVMRVPDGDGGVGNLTMKPAVIREGQVTVVDFDEASRITLSGTVRRGAQALPEVSLFFLAGDGGVTATDFKTTRSDATGRYEVGLERAGGYRVIVQSSEQLDFSRAANVEIAVPDEPRVDLDIVVRGGTISGSVVDEEGDPVRGASVLALADAASGRDRVTGVVSDADGRYHIEGLEDGTYGVTASAPGFRVASVHPVPIAGGDSAAIDLRLLRGDALRGRVVDAHGQGVPGALVLVGPSGSTEMATATSGQTDINGTFRVTAPVDGPLDITAIAAGWAPARLLGILPPSAPDAPEPLLRTSTGGRVRIRVLGNDGQPVPSVQLQLRAVPAILGGDMALLMNPPALTDVSGTTVVDRLAPGAYEVSVAGAAGPPPRSVTVAEGSETPLEIRLP
jgi:protocatechuate 3,4-dioxygenase beta subunit